MDIETNPHKHLEHLEHLEELEQDEIYVDDVLYHFKTALELERGGEVSFNEVEDIYDIYAQAIRAEYIQFPLASYIAKRGAALRHLQQKAIEGKLYGDAYFADQYNARAILNMQRELDQLAKN